MMTRFLAACRFLLIIPVIGCVVLTAGVFLMGVGRIATAGATLLRAGDFSPKASKTVSLAVIEIIGVIVAALAVAFLGQAAGSSEPGALLNYGGGIALVIVALAFFMRQNGKEAEPRDEE
jgi:uncharacterized membrane protein YqhA